MAAVSRLSPTQRYAAGTLLALALRQAQIHQTHALGLDDSDADRSSGASGGSASSDGVVPELWNHMSWGLLRPVFRFLDIDPNAWPGLEETAASSEVKHHVRAYLQKLFEEDGENSSEKCEQELALTKAVDAMVLSLEFSLPSGRQYEEKYNKQEHDSLEKIHHVDVHKRLNAKSDSCTSLEIRNTKAMFGAEALVNQLDVGEKSTIGDSPSNRQRKVSVLYELLSACVADSSQEEKRDPHLRNGYDARHRVALPLLATWLDVKWIKVVGQFHVLTKIWLPREAMEIMVACSAMAAVKEEIQSHDSESEKSTWSKWKHGVIIGAAALTGGTLLAISGGLASPAIAAGFGALAPTLGTLFPVIGASGFAAIASAAGSVSGSVAVAASFGAAGAGLSGSKMARRIGEIEEFEFKHIGENHNQGSLAVGILISGFAIEEEDFIRPWEGSQDNSERYAIQWESKNIIAVSTAIQDWLTSKLTMELMKQGAMMTVLSSLLTALAWPATFLSATDFIDSKWSIAIDRSDKAGILLAEVLLKGLQGNRPVTLIGFSLGARVVFKCLQKLAESGRNGGLVERVVLFGAPISVQGEHWEITRKMVAGRFINVYSTNDWILGVTFRASLLTQGLAGIQPIDVPGIENVDITEVIDGHSSYLWAVQRILDQLELDAYYPAFSDNSINSDQETTHHGI